MTRYLIGGDFELSSLSLGSVNNLSDFTHGITGTWTASGRAALTLILKKLKDLGVKLVHVPAFLCDSILLPITELGLDCDFYPVDLKLKSYPDPSPGSAIIVIHYFGWLDESIVQLRAEAGDKYHLIEDMTHAFLSDWRAGPEVSRSIFFTPRKFAPVPFGGWCSSDAVLKAPNNEIESLNYRSIIARMARSMYLEKNQYPVDSDYEEFYLDAFREVEEFLDKYPTYTSVPQIALEIIAGLDWANIAKKRRMNWQCLHELLAGHVEILQPSLPNDVVPLGYIVRLENRDAIRKSMAENRIFCPVHWPSSSVVPSKTFTQAALLSDTCLTLPIDQRYGIDDMTKLADTLKSYL